MKREDVHRCWAPANEPWSPWAKPVLFANLDEEVEPKPLAAAPEWLHRGIVEPMLEAGAVTPRELRILTAASCGCAIRRS